jgi:hypothetical protein
MHYRNKSKSAFAKKRYPQKSLRNFAFALLATIAMISIVSPTFSDNYNLETDDAAFAQLEKKWHSM